MIGILVRALAYATLFVGVVLVYLPAATLEWAGAPPPRQLEWPQILGAIAAAAGAALAMWCILTFAVAGRGTPAPFDPPRRLVVRGPYRHVRNPMYLGAGLALAGAAMFYQSAALLAYDAAFMLLMHGFVTLHEEPSLARTFGTDYAAYRRAVGRWSPRLSGQAG